MLAQAQVTVGDESLVRHTWRAHKCVRERLEARLSSLDDSGRGAFSLPCDGETKPWCAVQVCGQKLTFEPLFASTSMFEAADMLHAVLDDAGMP